MADARVRVEVCGQTCQMSVMKGARLLRRLYNSSSTSAASAQQQGSEMTRIQSHCDFMHSCMEFLFALSFPVFSTSILHPCSEEWRPYESVIKTNEGT